MKTKRQMEISVLGCVLAIVLSVVSVTSGQTKTVADGEEFKVLGIINTRSPDSFVMTTLDGSSSYVVALTPSTDVKSNTKGIFRGGKRYESTYLLRGLRVEVEGRGNSDGQLVAEEVNFNEVDLRTAQSLQSALTPVEAQVGANKANIASNTERIGATEENAKRMAGQIEENTAAAGRAQGSADAAMVEAER